MNTHDSNKKKKADKVKSRKQEDVRQPAPEKAGRGSLAAKIVVIALIVMMGSFFLLSNLAYLLN